MTQEELTTQVEALQQQMAGQASLLASLTANSTAGNGAAAPAGVQEVLANLGVSDTRTVQTEFPLPATLADEEIAFVLAQADPLTTWLQQVKEYALQQALAGKTWQGWKLVESRTVRCFTDTEAVAGALVAAGKNPYEQRLLSITALEKMLGTDFDTLVGAYVTRPQGKPVLAPASDKRQLYRTAAENLPAGAPA